VSTVVIVGASVAGVRTAQALRSNNFDGQVVVVGEESAMPYDKPPLSKALLTGQASTDTVALLRDDTVAKARLDLRLGTRASTLDVARRQVALTNGDQLPYDVVVLATGARARPSPWPAPSGVHVLRTLDDAQHIRHDLELGGHLVVVGGGFIGSEVASSARTLGLDVTVVDPLTDPSARAVGPDAGRLLSGLHQRHGTTTRFGTGVEAIDGERGALQVRLTDGDILPATTVVVGIGAQPNDQWLASSGLEIDDGVVCDEHCRATGTSDVYAAGDLARWLHPRHHELVRIEHWTNATEQAACVAHNITHPDDLRSHQPIEYVWSDQYDWKIQIAGRPAVADRSELVGDPASGARFAMVHGDSDDHLCGAVTVNWPRGVVECRRMLATGSTFGAACDRIRALFG